MWSIFECYGVDRTYSLTSHIRIVRYNKITDTCGVTERQDLADFKKREHENECNMIIFLFKE